MPESDVGVLPVVDQRRGPFCYQTHVALDAVRARYTGRERSTALAIYLAFTEIANRAGGESARGGFAKTRKEIAENAGVSVDTLDRYTRGFEEIGIIRVEKRKCGPVNLPNVWMLTEPEQGSPAPPSRTPGVRGSRTPGAPRARSSSEPKKTTKEKTLSRAAGEPPQTDLRTHPSLRLISGRNVALDALTEVTGILDGDPTIGKAVVALNGRAAVKGGLLPDVGIEEIAYAEVVAWCDQHDRPDYLQALHDDPAEWAETLARMIRRKAVMYHESMPGASLSPKALRDWWMRLEHMDVITGHIRPLTPDEIRNIEL